MQLDFAAAGKIAVIGDIMLDEYVWGEVTRISPEAPVPVVRMLRKSTTLGGAGNVANNIISLGGQAYLYGVVGYDVNGDQIIKMAPAGLIIKDSSRPTTIKTRIIAHSQHVARVDFEETVPLNEEIVAHIISALRQEDFKAIIVADYGKGVITPRLMFDIFRFARSKDIIVAIDPVTKNYELYNGATIITPNLSEFMPNLKEKCDILLLTKGAEGITLITREGSIDIPTVAKKVYDVSGAGDTVIATFVLSFISGMPIKEAAILANLAAGLVVEEVGTTTITLVKLIEAIKHSHEKVGLRSCSCE